MKKKPENPKEKKKKSKDSGEKDRYFRCGDPTYRR